MAGVSHFSLDILPGTTAAATTTATSWTSHKHHGWGAGGPRTPRPRRRDGIRETVSAERRTCVNNAYGHNHRPETRQSLSDAPGAALLFMFDDGESRKMADTPTHTLAHARTHSLSHALTTRRTRAPDWLNTRHMVNTVVTRIAATAVKTYAAAAPPE